MTSCWLEAVQRIFSPPNPPMSFSARSSFTLHISTSRSSFSLYAFFASRSSFRFWILSTTACSASCFSLSAAITSARSFSAAASWMRLGPTTLATRSYASMARTQEHKPYAALEAFLTTLSWKSFLARYGRIFLITFALMLSLSYFLSDSRNLGSISIFFAASQ